MDYLKLRKNLAYQIIKVSNKHSKLLALLQKTTKPTIVYTDTRDSCENLARWLQYQKINCNFYHGGLENATKKKHYESWKNEEIPCMVATNAFGMGIDKSNIQKVIHFKLPYSMENYMQEAGRAGRDGKKAFAIILFNENWDRQDFQNKVKKDRISIKNLKKIWGNLCGFFQICKGAYVENIFEFDIEKFSKKIHISLPETLKYLNVLHKNERIEIQKENNKTTLQFLVPNQGDLNINSIVQKIKNQENLKRKKLNDVWHFVSKNSCRSKMLLQYFEEKNYFSCGICDHCKEKKQVKQQNISLQILELFEEEKFLSLQEIIEKIKANETLIIKILRKLLEQEKLKMDTNFLFYLTLEKNKSKWL